VSDSYQAIYDAVRSRISQGNVGDAVADVARNAFDISCAVQGLTQEISSYADQVASAHRAPSAVYKPKLFLDGDQWCVLYGDDLQSGLAGFGDSPALAMADFDKAWIAPTVRKGGAS